MSKKITMIGFQRRSLFSRCAGCLCLLLWGLMTSMTALAADREASAEYKLKAALLYKLTKFIEWPAADNLEQVDEFNLCVLGDNVFGDELQPLTSRKVRQQHIELHYFDRSDEIDCPCHLLFITDSKRAFIDSIVRGLEKQGSLTVSDINGFAKQGGVIELTQRDKKIGFTINLSAAKKANITVAAPLLELSSVIGKPREGGADE